ncbi:MAG: hypothetical protein M1839_002100 [Geoglossum umbratile]|nr:MAG: hypothetical protein M1839_002100 [Geoglossum umbratile]
MASLTIIPYNPEKGNCPRTRDIFKPFSDYDGELRVKPGILLVDMPQPQAVADRVGGLTMHEDSNSQKSTDKGAPTIMSGSKKVSGTGEYENDDIQIEIDSLFGETDDIFEPKNNLITKVDHTVTEADTESKVGSNEI